MSFHRSKCKHGTIEDPSPNQSSTVECFVATPVPFGYGEGGRPTGQDSTVTTNASVDASFTCSTLVAIKVGFTGVTATATRLDSSTDPAAPTETPEFSDNVLVSCSR